MFFYIDDMKIYLNYLLMKKLVIDEYNSLIILPLLISFPSSLISLISSSKTFFESNSFFFFWLDLTIFNFHGHSFNIRIFK